MFRIKPGAPGALFDASTYPKLAESEKRG